MTREELRPSVAAVVLNYNGESVLEECLESLRHSEYPIREIVVVDNASQDRSVDIVTKKFPEAVLIRNELNLGAPAGRNVGVKRALSRKPDYIYTLDNDLRAHPAAIHELVKLLESDASIGCAGSLIYYHGSASDDLIFNAGNYINWTQNLVKSRAMNTRDRGQLAVCADVDYVGSGAMLVRSGLLEKLGAFDAGFIGYGYEDADFGLRVKAAGYRVVCFTRSKVWHRPFTAIGRYSFRKKYLEARNAIRFLRIHGTPWGWLKFSWYALGGLLYAAVREGFRGNFMGVVGKARGLYDGLRGREDLAWTLLNPPGLSSHLPRNPAERSHRSPSDSCK
jgi:GT2 family glycosyltransferase